MTGTLPAEGEDMDSWPLIIAITFAVVVIVLSFFIKDKDDDRYTSGEIHPAARIQQYRDYKSQASSYAEMDEWNDAIDEARKDLGNHRWP